MTAPGIAGVLVQTLSGPIAVLLDALTFVWSAASLMLIAGQLVGDGAAIVAQIAATTVRQASISDRLLGRVNSCMYLLRVGIAPFGALAGGLLAETIGVRPTIAVAVTGGMLDLLWLMWSPLPRLRETSAPIAPH